MPTNNTSGDPEQEPSPQRGGKNTPLTGWAFILALLGAGAMPCPDCGMPLAWHFWPLALLILAARWITGRRRKKPAEGSAPEPASGPRESPRS
jgi:hypothetical protein